MRVYVLRALAGAVALSAITAVTACQGNIGGGSGLSIPQAPGYGQPAGPQQSQSQSRERVLDGAVYLGPKLNEVPLPQLGGFGIVIELGTPGPLPSASPTAAAPPPGIKLPTPIRHLGSLATAVAGRQAGSASPTPAPSTSPFGAASAAPVGSAAPSAPAASESATPAAKATGHAPSPSPSGPGPRITTKTVIYPDDAPMAPTPIPTGEVQVFTKRSALVRGYVQPETDLTLYGLAAIRFTIPASELQPKRGFTIAVYQNGKHHHDRLLAYDTDPAVGSSVIASALTDPLVLKKGIGYLLLLYGDDTPPTPAPVAPGYPAPGNNPFPAPSGSGAAYPPASYSSAGPCASPTPYSPYGPPPTPGSPYASPTPYYPPCGSPTPFSPFGTPHP